MVSVGSSAMQREECTLKFLLMMFCCASALEAQRAGTRAAANKSKSKTSGSLSRARRATADARRGMKERG
jgi:hypothetical protein